MLSTYAKILNCNLYFPWVDCPFTIGSSNPTYHYRQGENKAWDKVRHEDYKFENYTEYFNLPKNVKINETVNNPTHLFTEILGGCVSPVLFYTKFLSNICSLAYFNDAFRETMREFTPTDKLKLLVEGNQKPNISVHLRRTDKINVNGDYHSFMTYEGLDTLNQKTQEVVNKLYSSDKLIYFSSDDINELDKYHKLYPNHIQHNISCLPIEKTYIDLYTMSVSEYIILSQIHSNFSVFASYINETKLIYLYEDSMIRTQQFNKSTNFIYYKDL
jgi:hypothetical protein